MLLCFFFFKQKTAYEMRISDWSSDVCSSDLSCHARCHPPIASPVWTSICAVGLPNGKTAIAASGTPPTPCVSPPSRQEFTAMTKGRLGSRSEEHTSELQSLMRISYAVFCLQKKHTYLDLTFITRIRDNIRRATILTSKT